MSKQMLIAELEQRLERYKNELRDMRNSVSRQTLRIAELGQCLNYLRARHVYTLNELGETEEAFGRKTI